MTSLLDRLANAIWGISYGLIVENQDAALIVTTSSREDEADADWICTLMVLKKEPEGRVSLNTSLDGQVFMVGSLRTGVTLSAGIWGGVALVRGMPLDEFCSTRVIPKDFEPIDVSDQLSRLYSMQLSLPYRGPEELIEPGLIFGLAGYSVASTDFGRQSDSFSLELRGDLHVGTTIPGAIESTLKSQSLDVTLNGQVTWEGNCFTIHFPPAPRGEYELVTRVI